MKVAYLEKRSTITRMVARSPTLGNPMMKSSDTLSRRSVGVPLLGVLYPRPHEQTEEREHRKKAHFTILLYVL